MGLESGTGERGWGTSSVCVVATVLGLTILSLQAEEGKSKQTISVLHSLPSTPTADPQSLQPLFAAE